MDEMKFRRAYLRGDVSCPYCGTEEDAIWDTYESVDQAFIQKAECSVCHEEWQDVSLQFGVEKAAGLPAEALAVPNIPFWLYDLVCDIQEGLRDWDSIKNALLNAGILKPESQA